MNLTQNQIDALQWLRNGGFFAVKGKQVWFEGGTPKYRLQRRTILSLKNHGLIHCVKSENDTDYYGLVEEKKE
jgi:hypothetical protein